MTAVFCFSILLLKSYVAQRSSINFNYSVMDLNPAISGYPASRLHSFH